MPSHRISRCSLFQRFEARLCPAYLAASRKERRGVLPLWRQIPGIALMIRAIPDAPEPKSKTQSVKRLHGELFDRQVAGP
jgi:hypothetical protein